jgi:class 3 adenylate cyclase/ATP/maltotriose-dependent transcriptional regulator MalT
MMKGLSRKTVTVLFSDVVDSTPLGEGLDPESLRALMARYFDEMRAVIERHGGTVEKYIGDAIMAVFGIPHVHEDDALRAVRAAAEMREALATVNARLPRPLATRTGINTGEVVAGSGHTLVTGDTVNIAARLERAADVNSILIGAATYHLVRDAVVAEPVERLDLKGKSMPVDAWRVSAVIRDAPGHSRRLDSPLVGRKLELALLRQAFERVAAQRSCHIFTLLGSAGVGKTRLANEMIADVSSRATVLAGRCRPYGDGITFWPLRDIIRTLPNLEEIVGAEDAQVVCGAVGLGEATAGADDTFRALRKLVEALAHDEPLVLIFEDVHWGQASFLDFVEHLAEWVREAPVLLLCVARPELLESRRGWGGGRLNATTILLEPLDERESALLVTNLGGDDVATELRHTITEVAEGNPLFVEEMVAMIREDPRAAESVPPTIHALLTARIEGLAPREREALQTASVVGRFFSREAVVALAGDVDAELAMLRKKDLVRTQADTDEHRDTFQFRHVLIRDAAYDALPKTVRISLHVALADWLATSKENQRRELDEVVGYHLERAVQLKEELGEVPQELAARAASALANAGHRALVRGDAAAARHLLERVASLPTPLDADRVERLLEFAAALEERGELLAAETVLAEALAGARSLHDARLEARSLVERSFLFFYADPQRWVDEALKTAERAIMVLDETGDDFGLARAWLLILLLHYGRCHVAEMEKALEPALHYARRARDGRLVAVALNASVRGLLIGPAPVDEALARAQTIADEPEADRALGAVACGVVGCLEAMRGRFEEARTAYAESHAVLQDLGRTRLQAAQRAYSGFVELLADDATAAERELRAGIVELETIGDKTNLATVAGLLAQALATQGRWNEAEAATEQSERASSSADVAAQVMWRLTRARLTARRGQVHDADRLSGEAVALAAATDSPTLLADALFCRADVAAAADLAVDAAAALTDAAEHYERKGHAVGAARARAELAQDGSARPSRSAVAPSTDGAVAGGT